jgi:universal stress protein E
MRSLHSILLATDFRTICDDALNVAGNLATQFAAEVSVLHVIHPAGAISHLFGLESAEELMKPILQNLAEKQVPVAQSAVKSGSPANMIINIAQEWNMDLIVIGAGERKQSGEFTIGPIAEAVIAHARQPVLAVRPGEPQLHFNKILCPVDQSSTSARGLKNAIRLAKTFNGEIVVLSVVPDVSWLTAAVETGELVDAKAEYANEWGLEFERFLETVDLSDVRWKHELRYGSPHEQIVASAKEHHVDLIVMGATGSTGVMQVMLGSTTKRLLQRLPCSLLIVKQDDILEDAFENDVRSIEDNLSEARKLSSEGDFISAIVKYRLVLTRNPYHLGALEGLASSHEKLGEVEDADRYRRRLQSARRVSHWHPDSTDVGF